jgi:uncharacterized protein YdhG (YjbR/CyaY superfamily)
MQSKLKSVPEFLKSLPEDRRKALSRLRTLVRTGLPRLKETMRYGMPSYEDSKGALRVAFNSQKNYMALYICDTDVLKLHQKALSGLDCGKSCIRFQRIEQLPAAVVGAMLKDVAKRVRSTAPAVLLLLGLMMTPVPGANADDDHHAAGKPAAAAAAPATTPKPSGEQGGLPAGLPVWHPPAEYSEDMIMKSGDQTMTMHRHIQGDRIRTEMALEDEQLVMIEKDGESYQIMPSHKMLMKMPAPAVAAMDSSGPADVRIEPLGAEKLNGHDTLKYRITSGDQTGLAWFDAANGAPLRMEANDASIEWANFAAGAQKDELFELPKDYQTIDLAQFMGAAGSAGGGIPTLPPGAVTGGQGAVTLKAAKRGQGTPSLPSGIPGGMPGMPGGASTGGGFSGLAQQMGGHFGQSMGEKFGSGMGAQFGPLGSVAGQYIGGRVGSWLGSHAAKMVTGGGSH